MKSYKELEVWEKAISLVTETYRLTESFPRDEIYTLTAQVKKSAISIPSNIAEGWGRGTTKEYLNFLRIARGSLMELETQIIIAANLEFIRNEQCASATMRIEEISRMLNGLIKSLKKHNRPC